MRSLSDKQLAVVNGKGPDRQAGAPLGSVEFLPQPSPADLAASAHTVLGNSPYRDDLLYGRIADAATTFFSAGSAHPSPIQHVIYLIKGNQAYSRFSPQITPNQHKLAEEFTGYDNFYSNAQSIAEGQNWALDAIAPEYTVKLWPSAYSGAAKSRTSKVANPLIFLPRVTCGATLYKQASQSGTMASG